MKEKILGIVLLMGAMLFIVVYAAGDNPTTARPERRVNQTVSVNIADVIAIETPTMVSNSWNSTDATTLFLLDGTGNDNTVTSRSNGRIDVFLRSSTGSTIPHTNTTYSNNTLNTFQFRSNETGTFVDFSTSFRMAIENWKIAQGTGPAGANISIPLRVNIPSFTADGFYNSTVTYVAVRGGRTPIS